MNLFYLFGDGSINRKKNLRKFCIMRYAQWCSIPSFFLGDTPSPNKKINSFLKESTTCFYLTTSFSFEQFCIKMLTHDKCMVLLINFHIFLHKPLCQHPLVIGINSLIKPDSALHRIACLSIWLLSCHCHAL
jgi:hypothetical protein